VIDGEFGHALVHLEVAGVVVTQQGLVFFYVDVLVLFELFADSHNPSVFLFSEFDVEVDPALPDAVGGVEQLFVCMS
jgi:hypothetical protein